MYNSKEYWNNRKDPNKYNHIMEYEQVSIVPFVKDADRVLDFGCGIGRTFPLYEDKQVTGVDFSSMYAERCDNRMSHIVHDVHSEDLPFKNDTFDVGLLIKVTLHATDKEVRRIISEVGRVCNKVMIIAYNGNLEKLAPHVFKHDYLSIIKELGFSIVSYEDVEDNQTVIVYEKSSRDSNI